MYLEHLVHAKAQEVQLHAAHAVEPPVAGEALDNGVELGAVLPHAQNEFPCEAGRFGLRAFALLAGHGEEGLLKVVHGMAVEEFLAVEAPPHRSESISTVSPGKRMLNT